MIKLGDNYVDTRRELVARGFLITAFNAWCALLFFVTFEKTI